jgi:hypothetical protein
MTKGRGALPENVVTEQEPLFIARVGALAMTPLARRQCSSVTTLSRSTALPFVISPEKSWASRPTQGDEKRVLFSNYSFLEAPHPPFVISTGAQRSGEICGQRSFLGMFFDKAKLRFLFQHPDEAANEDLDSIVVIGLNLSYIVHSANESQLDATGNNA